MRYEEIRGEIAAGTAAGTLPGWARRVLADVAAGRSRIAAVRHPLGFLCLPVERSGEFGVCLHLWSPEVRPAPPTTSELHCHSWELLSFVLYGTVRNVRVRVDDAGPGGDPTHRVFEVVSRDDVDELRATGRGVRYTSCGSAAHRTGESYALPAGIFHSTLIEGAGTPRPWRSAAARPAAATCRSGPSAPRGTACGARGATPATRRAPPCARPG